MNAWRTHGVIVAAMFVLTAAPCPAAPFSFDATPGRLPKNVVPRQYAIAIVPDVARERFSGTESVTLDVRRPTNTIQFDSLNEQLRDVRFDGAPVAAVDTSDARQLTTVRLQRASTRGRHVLAFAYRGRLEMSPRGLFIQRYDRDDGSPGAMLSTQFESIDARRMFPGWDEPAFRAAYTLTVTLPSTWVAVGNMPVARRVIRGTLATTTFARTPPMSSYLLELTAGDLVAVHGTSGRTALGVWAVRGQAVNGAYALANARTILTDYNDYFGVRYPLPKLDSIAIPSGFPGAMENWGAITYDASLLLAGPASTLEDRQQIYSTMAHEMAHMWNGDLVTTAWWNDIWLNESFASWRAARETDTRHPEWRWWENQDGDKELAMDADARLSSHAIVQPLTDEQTADAAFDSAIVYSKGQAFLRMLEAYLTPARFRDGVRRYVRAHAYGNATSDDLWYALAAATHRDVAALARTWTQQAGFPLVSVQAACDAGGNRTIELAQRRFTLGGTAGPTERWDIPLRIRSGRGPVRIVLFRNDGQRIAAGRCDEPLVLNAGGVGFYRVAYDDAAFAVNERAFATLPQPDKIVLLDDQWALANAGAAPLGSYLHLASALGDDRDQRAWEQVFGALDAMALDERGAPGETAYLAFARAVAAPLAAQLGWNARHGETAADEALRIAVIERLGDWRDPATIVEARGRFEHLRSNPLAFSPSLRGAILRIVAENADPVTFEALHALARSARGDTEKQRYYDALSRVRDPALAERALHIALSSEIPRALDNTRFSYVLNVARTSPLAAWDAVRAHAQTLLAPLGSTAPEDAAGALPAALWRAVPLADIQAWLDLHAATEKAIGIPRAIERAQQDLLRAPQLVAAADAYVANRRADVVRAVHTRRAR